MSWGHWEEHLMALIEELTDAAAEPSLLFSGFSTKIMLWDKCKNSSLNL